MSPRAAARAEARAEARASSTAIGYNGTHKHFVGPETGAETEPEQEPEQDADAHAVPLPRAERDPGADPGALTVPPVQPGRGATTDHVFTLHQLLMNVSEDIVSLNGHVVICTPDGQIVHDCYSDIALRADVIQAGQAYSMLKQMSKHPMFRAMFGRKLDENMDFCANPRAEAVSLVQVEQNVTADQKRRYEQNVAIFQDHILPKVQSAWDLFKQTATSMFKDELSRDLLAQVASETADRLGQNMCTIVAALYLCAGDYEDATSGDLRLQFATLTIENANNSDKKFQQFPSQDGARCSFVTTT